MDIISQFFPLILAAGVKPWALGVLVVILGLLGLVLLACCYDDKAEDGAFWNSELFEGCVLICGLMVVVPFCRKRCAGLSTSSICWKPWPWWW